MKKEIHFFDLDGTLWSVDTKAWIIKKNNPSKPIFKLSNIELHMILAGIYKNDEIELEYDGKKYWLSEELFEKIKKRIPSVEASDLGISFIEKINPIYYKKLKIFKENLRHLIGKDKDTYDFAILSARYNEENDKKLLVSLKEELENIGIEINKFYYVGDYYKPRIRTSDYNRKTDILLEHLVGFHIEDDHFVPIKQNIYRDVYFYDDEPSNINFANDLQDTLDGYLENTEDEVYDRIMYVIKNYKPKLHTNLVSNNSLNRFKTDIIELQEPIKYPIKIDENKKLKRFDDFKLNESLKNKLKGKSDNEIKNIKDKIIEKIVDFALEYYPEYYGDWLDTYEKFIDYEDDIIKRYKDGDSIESIVISYVDGRMW